MSDENLQVSNSKIVDIEWKILYALSSKNLNKLFVPRFQISLLVLTNSEFLQGGPSEQIAWSSKRETLKLKKVKFECDHEELSHLLFKVKSACNALDTMIKK